MANKVEYDRNLKSLAKRLRRNATPEENKLWYQFLKDYPVRFRRQVAIAHYILDFYCPTKNLAIELDGSHHYTDEGLKYDRIRTERLADYDIIVVRFPNYMINKYFISVCQYIDNIANGRQSI